MQMLVNRDTSNHPQRGDRANQAAIRGPAGENATGPGRGQPGTPLENLLRDCTASI